MAHLEHLLIYFGLFTGTIQILSIFSAFQISDSPVVLLAKYKNSKWPNLDASGAIQKLCFESKRPLFGLSLTTTKTGKFNQA
jgi:hypothetical protein